MTFAVTSPRSVWKTGAGGPGSEVEDARLLVDRAAVPFDSPRKTARQACRLNRRTLPIPERSDGVRDLNALGGLVRVKHLVVIFQANRPKILVHLLDRRHLVVGTGDLQLAALGVVGVDTFPLADGANIINRVVHRQRYRSRRFTAVTLG